MTPRGRGSIKESTGSSSNLLASSPGRTTGRSNTLTGFLFGSGSIRKNANGKPDEKKANLDIKVVEAKGLQRKFT